MNAPAPGGTIADCIGDGPQPGRAGKCAFVEHPAHLVGIHCRKKREYPGNRACSGNGLAQIDAIDAADFPWLVEAAERLLMDLVRPDG